MIKLLPPTKIICRDGYCPVIKSITDISRYASQPFGVNWASFSYKEVFGVDNHDGIDIAIPVGTPIYASTDGVIIEVDNTDDTDGLGIELYDKVQMCRTIYWHNSENKVSLGQKVIAGDLIALSGGTGKAYGPHLHYGLYLTNENGQVINRTNGYKGAIDPMPYLTFNTMDRLVRANKDDKKIWLIKNGFRFWVLDPDTLLRGNNKIWSKDIEIDDITKYQYGGQIFIANGDDPML